MPIYRAKNENFFKVWTSEMAYVLGFFAADGNLTLGRRGNHFLEFTSCDLEIMEKIREVMGCTHKITERSRNTKWKTYYRIQIGSKNIFSDLVKLGFTPNKSKSLESLVIPNGYLADFLRGYFDGDGSVWAGFQNKKDRKKSTLVVLTRFTSGSRKFLEELKKKLEIELNIKGGSLLFRSGAHVLGYSTTNSLNLYKFMYRGDNKLCLARKKAIFEDFITKRTRGVEA